MYKLRVSCLYIFLLYFMPPERFPRIGATLLEHTLRVLFNVMEHNRPTLRGDAAHDDKWHKAALEKLNIIGLLRDAHDSNARHERLHRVARWSRTLYVLG